MTSQKMLDLIPPYANDLRTVLREFAKEHPDAESVWLCMSLEHRCYILYATRITNRCYCSDKALTAELLAWTWNRVEPVIIQRQSERADAGIQVAYNCGSTTL